MCSVARQFVGTIIAADLIKSNIIGGHHGVVRYDAKQNSVGKSSVDDNDAAVRVLARRIHKRVP